jgi:acetylornithine deacetylase
MPELSALLASVDAARDEIVALLQDLVRLPTVNAGARPDTGDESLAAPLLSARLDAAGIPYETIFVTPGRANILARIGQGGGKRLLLMSHTDVVPVEDESLWEHPPFSGTLDRGRIYGRGADDDKGDVVAHLMAMVLLQRAGVALNGEALYLAAADEESVGNGALVDWRRSIRTSCV